METWQPLRELLRGTNPEAARLLGMDFQRGAATSARVRPASLSQAQDLAFFHLAVVHFAVKFGPEGKPLGVVSAVLRTRSR